MDRPKRPPPVPKFQDKNDKAELQKKFNTFINSINTPAQQPTQLDNKPQPIKIQPAAVRQQTKQQAGGKKKLTLASLNSKLNNMLSAKKININAAISSQVEKQKRQQLKKVIEIQYDPQHPSSYELTKNHYLPHLTTLTQSDSQQDQEVLHQQTHVEDRMDQEHEPQEKEQIALRMMQKFGYKVGEGLGKQSQGIRTPLIVRKTTDSSGIIQQSNIPLNFLISPEVCTKNALAAHSIQPTSVLVLVGLLSMEELQQGLQEQIKQQCCIYGIVCDWLLYLVEGQLRIFVEFQNTEQALNAYIKMNGKYFGERLVSVRFYDVDNFKKRVLSDRLHEHIVT